MFLLVLPRYLFWTILSLTFFSLTACATKETFIHHDENCSQSINKQNSEQTSCIDTSNLPSITLIKPTKGKQISSEFGLRSHPFKRQQCLHTGIDISGRRGDNVVASADGTVIFSGRRGSYGLVIDLDIGSGVVLRYAHLDRLGVKKGAKVSQGQYIGKLGRTGRVTAPHLHFEVRVNNIPVDPMLFITPHHQWSIKYPSPKPAVQKKI